MHFSDDRRIKSGVVAAHHLGYPSGEACLRVHDRVLVQAQVILQCL